MSGHHRTAGVDCRTITIEETEYTIRPLKVGVYAEMEAYIVSLRDDPLALAAAAVEKLAPVHHQAIWDAAMRQAANQRTVTAQQATDFENSIQGIAWKFWKCLEADHPEINSVDAAIKLLTKAGKNRLEEVMKAIELGSGEHDLKNSSGQDPTPTEETVLAGQ